MIISTRVYIMIISEGYGFSSWSLAMVNQVKDYSPPPTWKTTIVLSNIKLTFPFCCLSIFSISLLLNQLFRLSINLIKKSE